MNRDKHPGSATLEQGKFLCGVSPSFVDINFSKLKIIIFLNRISAIMYFKPQKLILSSQKYGLVVQELRQDTGLDPGFDPGINKVPDPICNPALNNQKVSKCLNFFCFLFRIFSLIWRAWGLLENGTGEESRSSARRCLAMWRNISPSA